ncbi:MAG: methyltransferase [Paracoccaceae bacterium]
MKQSRLSEALDQAGLLPEKGEILLLRPTAESDLTAFPKARSLILTGFRPDHDLFHRAGWRLSDGQSEMDVGSYGMACLFLPRAKAMGRALIARAAAAATLGAPIWIDGQKNGGIDSMLKDIKSRATLLFTLTASHGRSFAFANPGSAAFDDWVATETEPVPGFVTRPGVFSADAIDTGSALLATHLPAKLKGKGADLGAGWGWLASQILTRPEVKELHLVEAEAEALACARRNICDPRALFHWADARDFSAGKALDFVVMNPPFHQGRAADPGLGAAFVQSAQRILQPQGQLWMVANRTLPYEEALSEAFHQVTPVSYAQGFKVFLATRPKNPRKH